ncbi:MAG: hypothetical protein JKY65_09445 [Planctomycetes bacterium]|nr:hypothetical protein [Planctomycetota bacterium]
MTEPTHEDEELLLDLLTGFLQPAAAAALEERLASEEPLRALHTRLQEEQTALERALTSNALEAPPADLSERVLAGFAASEAAPGPTVSVGRSGPQASGSRASGSPSFGEPRQAAPAGRWRALLIAASLLLGAFLTLQALTPDPPHEVLNRQVRTSELLALGIAPEGPQ